MILTALRFILYNAFTSLARLFIDRQVQAHAATIFALVDRQMAPALATGSPAIVAETIKRAISTAAGLAVVDERQVQQVRDLFDPVEFVSRRIR